MTSGDITAIVMGLIAVITTLVNFITGDKKHKANKKDMDVNKKTLSDRILVLETKESQTQEKFDDIKNNMNRIEKKLDRLLEEKK